MYKKLAVLLVIGISLIPILFMASQLEKYAVNVPFGDDWALANLFYKIDHDSLSFSDLWGLHNEHRILFPQLAMIAIAYLTHWDLVAQMWTSFLFALMTFSIIGVFIYRRVNNLMLAATLIFLIAAWMFSPVQWENWIWGWQLTWFLSILAAISTIFLVNRIKGVRTTPFLFSSAVITAIIASFSLGGGLVIWICGLGMLFVRKTDVLAKAVWTFAGLASTLFYYIGYKKPPQSPDAFYFLHHMKEAGEYFLILLGRPVSDDQHTATVVASLVLASTVPILFSVWQKRRKVIKTALPFIAIIIFCVMIMALTTISRVGFGVGQAASSRYTALAILLIVSLFSIVGIIVAAGSKKQKYGLVVVGLFAINAPLLVFSYSNGIFGLEQRSNYMKAVKNCTHRKVLTPDCAKEAFPGFGGIVETELPYVKDKHRGGY